MISELRRPFSSQATRLPLQLDSFAIVFRRRRSTFIAPSAIHLLVVLWSGDFCEPFTPRPNHGVA